MVERNQRAAMFAVRRYFGTFHAATEQADIDYRLRDHSRLHGWFIVSPLGGAPTEAGHHCNGCSR